VSKLVFNLDPGTSTEVIALFDMELFAKGKVGARSLHIFQNEPVPEKAAPQPSAAQPPPNLRSGARGLWVAAALLFGIASALAGIYYTQRTSTAAAAVEEHVPTMTVFPDPSDATIKMGDYTIAPGVPIPLNADTALPVTVQVERSGYRPKKIEISE